MNIASFETKMTIVVCKNNPKSKADQAKFISQAVIKAYELCQESDPASLYQWEANSWPKICLKANKLDELI